MYSKKILFSSFSEKIFLKPTEKLAHIFLKIVVRVLFKKQGKVRSARKKLTAAASHENFSRTLNGYVFCTNQLILYDLLAILPC